MGLGKTCCHKSASHGSMAAAQTGPGRSQQPTQASTQNVLLKGLFGSCSNLNSQVPQALLELIFCFDPPAPRRLQPRCGVEMRRYRRVASVCTLLRTCEHAFKHARTCVCMHVCMWVGVCVHACAYIHARMYACVRVCCKHAKTRTECT